MIAKKTTAKAPSTKRQPVKKLIVGNWKANVEKPAEANNLLKLIRAKAAKSKTAKVVACPSWAFLGMAYAATKGKSSSLVLGVQDVSLYEAGSRTGENIASVAAKLGATYAIVGHSERRAMGETDEVVARKAARAFEQGMTPIVCVGEADRDAHGLYLGLIKKQVLASLSEIPKSKMSSIVLAYEPVYAIGAKKALEVGDIEQMALYLRKVLVDAFGNEAASVRILYGGSVFPDTARSILHEAGVDGLLIGRASVDAAQFNTIIDCA